MTEYFQEHKKIKKGSGNSIVWKNIYEEKLQTIKIEMLNLLPDFKFFEQVPGFKVQKSVGIFLTFYYVDQGLQYYL